MVLQNALILLMASKVTQLIRSDPCITMAIKIFRATNRLQSAGTKKSLLQARLAALFAADVTEDADDDDDDDHGAADMCDRLSDIGASIEALKEEIHADFDAMEEV